MVGANLRVDGGHFPGGGCGPPDPLVASLFASATDSAVSVDNSWSDALITGAAGTKSRRSEE